MLKQFIFVVVVVVVVEYSGSLWFLVKFSYILIWLLFTKFYFG